MRYRGLGIGRTLIHRITNPVDDVLPGRAEVFDNRKDVVASVIASLLPFASGQRGRTEAQRTLHFDVALLVSALGKYVVAQLLPRNGMSGPSCRYQGGRNILLCVPPIVRVRRRSWRSAKDGQSNRRGSYGPSRDGSRQWPAA